MATGRRSARRQAVFVLYQQDLLGLDVEAALLRGADTKVDDYAAGLVRGVAEHLAQIDDTLGKHVEGWSLQRLGVLERAILRLAAYELIWEPEVPSAVVMDEAVESAKRFCSDEAGSLVNGVLGSLAGSVPIEETGI
jgi:transcription antitermination protein NusB